MIELELHAHTHFSIDSLNRVPDLIRAARAAGLDRIAVTDHNEMAGALRAQRLAPDLVIVGEEVMTSVGELLCLFLSEPIRPGLEPEEAIALVHQQGGLVGASHPLDRQRAGIGPHHARRLRQKLDFFEVYNGRTRNADDNSQALALARELDLPGTCGSDAHLLSEIGRCRVRMREYGSPRDFLAALRDAELVTRQSPSRVRLVSWFAAMAHNLGLDQPEG